MKTKEYFVNKLSFRTDYKLIQDVTIYEYDGTNLSSGQNRDRNWMIEKINNGSPISILTPDPGKSGTWERGSKFLYVNGYFTWGKKLPKNTPCRKTFVSF